MTLFFVDDVLNVIYKDKALNLKLKDIIFQGNINDRTRFMEEFIKFLKREKIKSKLFGDNITIVKNVSFNNRDLYFLENTFLELGFSKLEFMDIKSLLPDMPGLFIEINNNDMVIYKEDGLFISLKYIKDIPKVINYFAGDTKSDIVLFGTNKYIPDIKIKDIHLYYLDNYNNYITESLLKVKKYDA